MEARSNLTANTLICPSVTDRSPPTQGEDVADDVFAEDVSEDAMV